MNLIKCKNGHYYNADKLDTCPHCAGENIKIPVADPEGKDQTAIDTLIPDRLRQDIFEKGKKHTSLGIIEVISSPFFLTQIIFPRRNILSLSFLTNTLFTGSFS